MQYTSIFSPGKKISPAQYISELICANKANHFKINLPTKFWDYPEWAQYYKAQMFKAGQFLRYYNAEVLIKVIKEKNIWTLFASWIVEEFLKEKRRVDSLVIPEINHTRIIDSTGAKNKTTDFSKFD